MKIALVEYSTKNHYSLIYNWLKISEINGWDVVLFITKEIYNATKVAYDFLNFELVLYDNMNIVDFFDMKSKINEKHVNQTIFLTMQSKFIEFYLSGIKNINYAVTIHNTNVWFASNNPTKPSHYVKQVIRKAIKKSSNYFIVTSSNMLDSITSTCKVEQAIYIMPFSLKFNKEFEKKNNSFTVIYPGTVDVRRRKYDKFLELAIKNPNDTFVVLGKPSTDNKSQEVFKKLRNLNNITTFLEFISIEDYTKYIDKADILYSDLVINYKISDMSEIYGKTKDSGISYLMLEFRKPALLNNAFSNLKELQRGTLYFDSFKSLNDKYRLMSNVHYTETLKNNIIEDSRNFNLDCFANSLKNLELQ